jgi:molybdopterin-binding protein
LTNGGALTRQPLIVPRGSVGANIDGCAGTSVEDVQLSARNQLEGTVVRVDLGAVMATVVGRLAGGQDVVSAITKDAAVALALREGDAVKAVIKSTEVMIGKD